IDSSGRIQLWNRAMNRLTGQPEDSDPVQENLADVPAEVTQVLYEHWQALRDNPDPALRVRIKVGERQYNVESISLPDDCVAFLIETDNEQARNNVLYTVLHDLQNPLTGIKGFVELIENVGPLNERQEHYAGRVYAAIGEITELASHLLDIAWIDSGIAVNRKPINFAHLAHAVATSHIPHAQDRGIRLALDIDPVSPVECDERRMKQVLNNLVGNAIKYSNEGEVIVSVKETDGIVEFSVIDQGIGIPEEFQEKIFERFFRVQSRETDNIQGTGLGLAITYEILQKHGVTLHVESESGVGSHFFFRLPAVSIPDPHE
ncbi:MAG TPA: HAMP domain-containing sensor histidine kinase, partial [Aggregatilineales bacterium]|nr:HAMP domain-containing sensor histidine kinase [Aggregatilineales bacterium]